MKRSNCTILMLMIILLGSCGEDTRPISSVEQEKPSGEEPSSYMESQVQELRDAASAGRKFVLRCHYAAPEDSVLTKPLASPFVLARDSGKNLIVMRGDEEDGYFVPTSIASRSLLGLGPVVEEFPATRAAMRTLCVDTVETSCAPSREEGTSFWKMNAQTYLSFGKLEKGFPIAFPGDKKKLVVFGDSLSDNGNLYAWLSHVTLRLFVMPTVPYFYGQFSNKWIWTDYLPFPKYLIDPAFAEGTLDIAIQDWAYGGEITSMEVPRLQLNTKDVPLQDILPNIGGAIMIWGQDLLCGTLTRTVRKYTNRIARGQVEDPENTIFFLWAGVNDYGQVLNNSDFLNAFLDADGPRGYKKVADVSTDGTVGSARKLIDAGARNIMIGTIPDLGLAPQILMTDVYEPENAAQYTADERRYLLSRQLTPAALYYSKLLHEKADALQAQNPNVNVVVFDFLDVLYHVLDSEKLDGTPFDYGVDFDAFAYSLYPPTDVQGDPIVLYWPCYQGAMGGIPACKEAGCLCSNPQRAPFFDMVHPSSYTRCWISYYIHKALFDASFVETEPLDMDNQKTFCEQMNPLG